MKRSLWATVTFGLLMLPTPVARATVVATLTDLVGDPNTVDVLPGSSFTVVVELDTTESLVSGQLMVQASASDIFTLDAVSFDGVIWSNDPADVLDPTPELLIAANGNTSGDIGSVTLDLVNGTGIGVMDFVTIQVSVDENAPEGLYTLDIVNQIFGITLFEKAASSAGPSYEVSVIPEPAAVALGILGIGLIVWARRRPA